jgi:dihydroorotase
MLQKSNSAENQGRYDLLLKGGHVVDPAGERDGRFDVAIRGGLIAAVELSIPKGRAKRVLDVTGKLVTPGLIDTHAHVFQHVAGPFGLNPDAVGIQSGVSTLIDQGGPSCLTIDGFRKYIVEPAQTRVCCFISSYLVGGLYGHIYGDLYGPDQMNVEATVRSIEANREIVRGIKSHAEPGHYSRWGTAILSKSKEIGRATGLPVYIHLGTLWPVKNGAVVDPQALLSEVIPMVDSGDILAHPFTRHPSGFTDEAGKVHPLVFEAIARGVTIDVGRGNHFSIKMARAVLDAGVLPDTLGADLHGYNITPAGANAGARLLTQAQGAKTQQTVGGDDPAFSLYYVMTEMLALGIPLRHLLAMVTVNAAKMMRANDRLGSLAVGRIADVAVMELQSGDFMLRDGCGESLKATQRFRPFLTLTDGRVTRPSSDYLPFWEREAA